MKGVLTLLPGRVKGSCFSSTGRGKQKVAVGLGRDRTCDIVGAGAGGGDACGEETAGGHRQGPSVKEASLSRTAESKALAEANTKGMKRPGRAEGSL